MAGPRTAMHENSEGLSSATNPKPKGGYHPIACSGKPNPSKRHVCVRLTISTRQLGCMNRKHVAYCKHSQWAWLQ